MSQLDLLQRLQEVDTEIREKKQRLMVVLKSQRETEALLAARSRAKQAEATVSDLKMQQQDLNLQIGTLTSRVQQGERKLYSGKVQSPKELEDLQESIEALKRQRSGLEDDALEVMVLLEDATAELESAETDLVAVETAWEQDQAGFREEQNKLALELQHLLALRTERAALIRPELVSEYEAIAKRSRGVGIATISYGKCLACLVTIPVNKVRTAQQGQIIHCSNCGRILAPA